MCVTLAEYFGGQRCVCGRAVWWTDMCVWAISLMDRDVCPSSIMDKDVCVVLTEQFNRWVLVSPFNKCMCVWLWVWIGKYFDGLFVIIKSADFAVNTNKAMRVEFWVSVIMISYPRMTKTVAIVHLYFPLCLNVKRSNDKHSYVGYGTLNWTNTINYVYIFL